MKVSILAASLMVLATLTEASQSNKHHSSPKITRLPGLEKIKHIVYFMQVHFFISHIMECF